MRWSFSVFYHHALLLNRLAFLWSQNRLDSSYTCQSNLSCFLNFIVTEKRAKNTVVKTRFDKKTD